MADPSKPLPLTYGATSSQTLRRGEYRSFTYRLPMHVPELNLSVSCETGCVCVYASNCSERPSPRNCQWTLLVDAEKKSSMGSLIVRTTEQHFKGGIYHVGLYCVSDASFSIGCFPTAPRKSTQLRSTSQRSPGSRDAQKKLGGRPFVDAGLLECLIAQRSVPPALMSSSPAPSEPPAHAVRIANAVLNPVSPREPLPPGIALGTPSRAAGSQLPALRSEPVSPRNFHPAPAWLGGGWYAP